MDRARRVGYRALEVCTGFLDLIHRPGHVPDIVQGIEHPENINAVFIGCRDEFVDNIIRIMAVSDKVLPPQQHLDGRLPEFGLECPETIPWIVIQKPDTGIERSAAPRFDRKEPAVIDLPRQRKHILCPESRCDQRLVRIAQRRVSDQDFLRRCSAHRGNLRRDSKIICSLSKIHRYSIKNSLTGMKVIVQMHTAVTPAMTSVRVVLNTGQRVPPLQ